MHIKLKGLQEIVVEVEGKQGKENLGKFKGYLTKRRDRSRERELKFIHRYLDSYYQDNLQVI